MNRILLILPILLPVGCAPDAPDRPSFQQDVLPILAANCVRCHGTPAIGGAPEDFRLDVFGDHAIANPDGIGADLVISGAETYSTIAALAVARSERPMPPRFALDDYQIEILANWAEDPQRGAPRPGNHPPTIAIEGTSQDGRIVTIDARVTDPDPDIVGGALRAQIGNTVVQLGLLRSGPNRIVWDTEGLRPGDFTLIATLDDGAAEIAVDLGTLTVETP